METETTNGIAREGRKKDCVHALEGLPRKFRGVEEGDPLTRPGHPPTREDASLGEGKKDQGEKNRARSWGEPTMRGTHHS